MGKPKAKAKKNPPKDVNQLAASILQMATGGSEPERRSDPPEAKKKP